MECKGIIKWDNELGESHYYLCKNPSRFNLKYKDITGKEKSENMCGIHCNSIKKWASRVERITGNKIKLNITNVI